MKRTIWVWQFFGFAITVLGGTFLHFLYDLTGGNIWTAPFSGVNESTWEHMKLLFWPTFIYAIIQSFFFKSESYFWRVKLRGICTGLILIPTIFYTYNGAIGKSPDWVNIAIFFISAATAYLYETKLFSKEKIICVFPKIPFLALAFIAFLFVLFTFYTPSLGIFIDPTNDAIGIQ